MHTKPKTPNQKCIYCYTHVLLARLYRSNIPLLSILTKRELFSHFPPLKYENVFKKYSKTAL